MIKTPSKLPKPYQSLNKPTLTNTKSAESQETPPLGKVEALYDQITPKQKSDIDPTSEKGLKILIANLDKELKYLIKEEDNLGIAEVLLQLKNAYNQLGDYKKVEAITKRMRKLQIDATRELRAEIDKIARQAEKEKEFTLAMEIWEHCEELSSQLFTAGLLEESENVKKFSALKSIYSSLL